jgi:hypothetical protein
VAWLGDVKTITPTPDSQPQLPLETPKDIARLIPCTPQHVLNMYHSGIIPARVAVGRIIRFDRSEVFAALAAHSKRKGGRP